MNEAMLYLFGALVPEGAGPWRRRIVPGVATGATLVMLSLVLPFGGSHFRAGVLGAGVFLSYVGVIVNVRLSLQRRRDRRSDDPDADRGT
jgi:hypothetical protein